MIHRLAIVAAMVPAIILAGHGAGRAAEAKNIDVRAILDKFDDLWRGQSSEGEMTMQIRTKHWERSLTMQAWSLGKDRTLVKVLKPLKERGMASLKVGKEVYNYLPDTDRTIKITSAMMTGSWMGSHFTNDDLVKGSRMADDYDSKAGFTGIRDGVEIIEIISTPKPNAAVVWGRVVTVARTSDWQPLKVLYYDEDGKLSRTETLSGHKVISGRLLPTVMRMEPADKPGEFTEVSYGNLKFDVNLKESFFSLNQLRR